MQKISGIKSMEIVKVDKKGRILIPKDIREKIGVKEEGYVKVRVDEKGITIEPIEPIADKYFGAFKITKWPDDLDEFITEVMERWLIQKAM
ncbi:MAG: AbrB/MazE/SpoVT family DNA-binding domain-containing protein [Candidatus Nitrosocaldus sp.]